MTTPTDGDGAGVGVTVPFEVVSREASLLEGMAGGRGNPGSGSRGVPVCGADEGGNSVTRTGGG
jgi:hypothetical protein